MDRRGALASVGTILLTSTSGCIFLLADDEEESDGGGDGSDGGGDGGDESGGTPTATEQPVYGIGESFTVGSGDKTVEYTVESVDTFASLGGDIAGEEASGVFVVVVLEMTNRADESIDVTSNHLKLVDDQDRQFDADAGASVYVETDPRIAAEGFAFEQLNPGVTSTGAVVYDVSPGAAYELLVEPVGIFSTADPKRVDLGEITAP